MADYKKSGFTPRPFVKTVMDIQKLRLSAAPTAGASRPHELAVSLYNSNPGITVFTNIPEDKNRGIIRAGMDPQAFFQLIDRIRAVSDYQGEVTEIFENKEKVKDEQTGKNVMQTVTRTVIGKGKDGKVFLSILSTDNDRPKIKFVFGQHYYHPMTRREGTPLTDADISASAARGWANLMENLVPAAMAVSYEPPPKRDEGGGGYGGSNSGGNKQSREEPSFDFDDIPM